MAAKTMQGTGRESEDSESEEEFDVIIGNVPCVMKTSPLLYKKRFPNYKEPTEVGNFSRDEKGRFKHDKSALKIFMPPLDWEHCHFNLRAGFDKMIEPLDSSKIEDGSGGHSIFRWIMLNKEKFHPRYDVCSRSEAHDLAPDNSKNLKPLFSSLNTDFVCWRSAFTNLLCAPYQGKCEAAYAVGIIRFRGTYYIEEFETLEQAVQEEERPALVEEIMNGWGFKFEQYVTADRSSGIPDTVSPVNRNEAFYSVVRTSLESHSLLFASEIDCKDMSSKRKNKYIELKTNAMIGSDRQYKNFCRFKLIKWWAQSFLHGVPIVVCGFRDGEGVVHKLGSFRVMDLPYKASDAIYNPWEPAVCFNFLDAFLQHVKSMITEDNERRVYYFKWKPDSDNMSCVITEDPEMNFLPDWFVKWDAWDKPWAE